MDNLILYTRDLCPFCEELKTELKNYVDHVDVDIREIPTRAERDVLYKEWGLSGNKATMPQLFLVRDDGSLERIGDSKESSEWLEVMYS